MRMLLSLAVIVGVFALGNGVPAQGNPAPKPPYTSEVMLQRIAGGSATTPGERMACVHPDKTVAPLNTTVRRDGRGMRCLEVLDQNFGSRGPAWTVLPLYTSEAMLRRDRDAATTTDRADAVQCVLPDRTERAVSATVTVDGRTYRCVELLDENFEPRGAAWTPVASRPF
jgi:hypothetical protein